jgi:vacuolar protein sorting-associated protein 51
VSPAPPNATQRRNRVALRDYYNLKSQSAGHPHNTIPSRTGSVTSIASNGTASAFDDPPTSLSLSQLDQADFNADSYVQDLLSTSSLKTVLKAESSLVSEVRNLDGERKALVYDNYSMLITATETIGTMRKSMDDENGGGGGLKSINRIGPAVDDVVRSAAGLSKRNSKSDDGGGQQQQRQQRRQDLSKQDTVRWVLDTPARLRRTLASGKRPEAEQDWDEIRSLLVGKWKDVRGVAELRDACQEVMARQASTDYSEHANHTG